MAKLQLQMEMSPGAGQALAAAIQKRLSEMMWNRFLLRSSAILPKIGDLLAAKFLETEVGSALASPAGGTDSLIGHLGLSADLARQLAAGMEKLIRESVKASPGKGEIAIQIKAVSTDWAAYQALPGARYVSKPSGRVIPVAEWLLVDSNIDVGQAEYNIAWRGEYGSERSFKNSRSGLAVMVHEKRWGKYWHGPWVLPAWAHQIGGKNFIEYTLGQEGVAKAVLGIVTEGMR